MPTTPLVAIASALKKHLPLAVIITALLVNDAVTWLELRAAVGWWLGGFKGTLAATSIVLLATAVTCAFFFEGLEERHTKRLHAVAGFLYGTIAVAVYAACVEQGMRTFPPEVASVAFGMSPQRAVVAGAVVIGAALALTTLVFWSVIGALIQVHVARERTARRLREVEGGPPPAQVVDLAERAGREQWR
jgi:hypothetical protein